MNKLNRIRVIKTATVAVLLLSFMVPLLSIGTTQACWWRKPLRAEMILNLDNMRPAGPSEPGYNPDPEPGDWISLLTWSGSIIGDIDGYMVFYLTNYHLEGPNNEWGHFWETWQIYDEEDGTLLMEGYDEGYTHQTTGYYAMVGRVTYTSPEFAKWQGHIVFMYGRINPPPAEWSDPPVAEAPGRFFVF